MTGPCRVTVAAFAQPTISALIAAISLDVEGMLMLVGNCKQQTTSTRRDHSTATAAGFTTRLTLKPTATSILYDCFSPVQCYMAFRTESFQQSRTLLCSSQQIELERYHGTNGAMHSGVPCMSSAAAGCVHRSV